MPVPATGCGRCTPGTTDTSHQARPAALHAAGLFIPRKGFSMQLKILIAAIAASMAVVAFADEPTVVPLDKGPRVNNLPPDTVLVKRGDTVVTAGDFMAQIEKLPEDQRFTYR